MMKLLWNRARQRHEGDDGFTLVELLVVVVIIGILVAIAIPVFLSQREKAWVSAAESDLRNAAPIAETFFADTGFYTGLTKDGMRTSEGVVLTIVQATATEYCITANHNKLDDSKNYMLRSSEGTVHQGNC